MDIKDLIIVGAGPAGMSTAIYMARAGHSVLLFEKLAPGGQAALTHSIENYPGFEEPINGMELSDKMKRQAERFGSEFEYDSVETISFDPNTKCYTVVSGLGKEFHAKSVLISTGTVSKRLHAKGEDRYFGNGIGTCAVCDGAFYKDKIVAVIGGGNSALEESLYLSNIVKKVYIIHRRREFRAEKFVQDQITKRENVEFILDTVVEEFVGDKKLNKVILKNVQSNEITEKEIDGVFLYVGLDANTGFIDAEYKDQNGFIKIDNHFNVDGNGMFAAGDCCVGAIKQVVCACGDGVKASYSISEYLQHLSI